MALIGHTIIFPNDNDVNVEHLDFITVFMNRICQWFYQILLSLPALYRFVEDLLVDCIFLGAAFTTESSIHMLATKELDIPLPIVGYSSLTCPKRKLWLIMGAKLGELRYNLDQANLEDFDINPEHIGRTQDEIEEMEREECGYHDNPDFNSRAMPKPVTQRELLNWKQRASIELQPESSQEDTGDNESSHE